MARLPDETKARYDLSSHRVAIHAAAPCPPELKQQMIDWWGPIVWEFYAGSEAVGYTSIDSAEALARPGSVGRSGFGDLHILDGDGKALPAREIGHIYFARSEEHTSELQSLMRTSYAFYFFKTKTIYYI